ncbi:peptide deformylase [Metamycoplasma subdolum]|uniref:Peptide deformylase n=1 Tax=Metamycoplasma subdolum TaxID=92407 RepID=A0A3M0AE39_9BACT|nr:peptide deformylase [Metamycoplasma subdolum]RMA77422.1 peptide deformylase [Metamycoplasma subdolum]WPB50401.1 peptide deformylase [Metamycoplasma subdolum]
MFKFEDVKLVQLPAKILRNKSKDVPLPLEKEDEKLIQKMIFHVDSSQEEGSQFRPAVGVAAIQYGIEKNIFYIMIKDKEEIIFKDALVNPVLLAHSESKLALNEGEGCLSVKEEEPNQEGYVCRYARVVAEAYSYFEKKVKRYDLVGYAAIVFQHEYDHLQGKLFIDHINKKDPWKLPKNCEVI